MHRIYLLTVGAKADSAVAGQKRRNLWAQLFLLCLDPAQDAVARQDDIRCLLLGQIVERGREMRDHVLRLSEGQNDAFVDCGKEHQIAIVRDLADGADVMLAADPDNDRVGCEGKAGELFWILSQQAGIFSRGWLGVDFMDLSQCRIGAGDDHTLLGGSQVIRVKDANAAAAAHLDDNGCVLSGVTIKEDMRGREIRTIPG